MAPDVNCVIVGAQKAGTTALASFLAEHPDVCVSPAKEVHLFDAPDFEPTRAFCDARYATAFPNYRGQKVVVDATPIYMYLPVAVRRIHWYNPAVRLIAILRNPSERAWSHYAMERRRGRESLSFAAAALAEPYRLWRGRDNLAWGSVVRVKSYVDRGFYSRQIADLLRIVPRDQLLLLRTDDLRNRQDAVMAEVYQFLGLTRPVTLPRVREVRPDEGPTVAVHGLRPTAFESRLLQLAYLREIPRLEALLGADLRDWRRPLRAASD